MTLIRGMEGMLLIIIRHDDHKDYQRIDKMNLEEWNLLDKRGKVNPLSTLDELTGHQNGKQPESN
jgi:hypothetical protein